MRPGQDSAFKGRVAEVGAAKVSVAEIGVAEIGPAQVRPLQVCPVEFRAAEVRTFKVAPRRSVSLRSARSRRALRSEARARLAWRISVASISIIPNGSVRCLPRARTEPAWRPSRRAASRGRSLRSSRGRTRPHQDHPERLLVTSATQSLLPRSWGSGTRETPAVQGRYDTSRTKLLCFGAAGFKDSLRREAAANGDLILVDADELYGG